MFDLRVPFFIPLWRRIIAVVLIFGWTAVELIHGTMFWAGLVGLAGLAAVWQFFLAWVPPKQDPPQDPQERKDDG